MYEGIMATIRSSDEIYTVLEKAFESSKVPLTCADLMDRPEVKAAALERFGKDIQISTNKLSDMLGFMWRKGVLNRFPATSTRSMARFAYALKGKEVVVDEQPILRNTSDVPKLGKHALSIVERDGEVILDFKQFTIIVRSK
jgi:hypothetical protein